MNNKIYHFEYITHKRYTMRSFYFSLQMISYHSKMKYRNAPVMWIILSNLLRGEYIYQKRRYRMFVVLNIHRKRMEALPEFKLRNFVCLLLNILLVYLCAMEMNSIYTRISFNIFWCVSYFSFHGQNHTYTYTWHNKWHIQELFESTYSIKQVRL